MKSLNDIQRGDVLKSLAQLDEGVPHRWSVSRKYDLLHDGKRYSPKAVLGLTICRLRRLDQHAIDLSGGDGTNRVLQKLGFEIVEKASATRSAK